MNRSASLLFALGWVAGCAPASDENRSDDEASFTATFAHASWQPIVSCDDGAMTVEVDTKERRQLRVVVHDLAIARYVSQGQYETTYQSNRCGELGSFATNPCVAENGDLALPGVTDSGVFTPAGFAWMRGTAQYFNGYRNVDFTAWRDGAGLRLERMSDSEQRSTCDYGGSGSCAPPENVPASKEVYADWRFRSCTNL
jgi:hypothetical protein